jgi:hypothetical protein
MSDGAYQNAIRRRDEIIAEVRDTEAKLTELRNEHRRVDLFIQQWHEFAGTPILDRAPAVVHHPRSIATSGRSVRNSKKEDVAEAAQRILRDEGHPLSRTELYTRLVAQGLTIEGTDPEMVLSTMLWRMKDKVIRLSGGGYWLPDVPYERASFHAKPAIDELFGSVDEDEPAPTDHN